MRVSEVSFGCMSLGADEAINKQLITQALDNGINLFDTADLYDKGFNETMLGSLLKPHRSKVILATKVGNQWREDGSGWDWNPRKDYILKAVDDSLRRLQTDYIDLYQLHGGTLEDDIDETISAFELLQQQGKIRYYGISSIRPNVIRAYVERSNIVSVMMQYSLLDRRPEETCLPLLQQHNIGILARGSVAKGLLAGKNPEPYLDYTVQDVAKAAQAIQQVAGTQRSAAQTAIQFVLQQPVISSAVVGIRTEQQLYDALNTTSVQHLTPHETMLLKQSLPANYYTQHR
ncbi:oxidoreductase, aldo/keto reductase family protein [Filimonas lacunae]|nr:oxidoreductase, aldo/keto reductase family protein [Filimonas lacunae]